MVVSFGKYHCKIEYFCFVLGLGMLERNSFIPKLSEDDSPVVIPEHGDYELKCLAPEGNPAPTVK